MGCSRESEIGNQKEVIVEQIGVMPILDLRGPLLRVSVPLAERVVNSGIGVLDGMLRTLAKAGICGPILGPMG